MSIPLNIQLPDRIADKPQEYLSDEEVRQLMRAVELIRELNALEPLLDKLNRVCGVHYASRDLKEAMFRDGQMLGWFFRHIKNRYPIHGSPLEYVELLEYALNHELTVE